jgi:hypothetical protein
LYYSALVRAKASQGGGGSWIESRFYCLGRIFSIILHDEYSSSRKLFLVSRAQLK